MKKILFAVFFTLLLLACESNEYLLSGESEMWSGKMSETQVDGYRVLNFTLHYKGKEKKNVGEISFLVEYNGGKFGSEDVTLDESFDLLSGSKCKGCASLTETENIDVTVEWDGNIEKFSLN